VLRHPLTAVDCGGELRVLGDPAVVLPQLLLCGLLVPRGEMAAALDAISAVLPMTYAIDAMTLLTHTSSLSEELLADLAVIGLAGVAALALGAVTLRRHTD
jgi:ABC-2 type transport system permease protein